MTRTPGLMPLCTPHVRCVLGRLTKPACPAQSCATQRETRHPGPPGPPGLSGSSVPATVTGPVDFRRVDRDGEPRVTVLLLSVSGPRLRLPLSPVASPSPRRRLRVRPTRTPPGARRGAAAQSRWALTECSTVASGCATPAGGS